MLTPRRTESVEVEISFWEKNEPPARLGAAMAKCHAEKEIPSMFIIRREC